MESGGIVPPFSISVLDGGEWSASRPGSFIWKIIVVYSEKHTQHLNAVCGQNVQIFNVQANGKYSESFVLRVKS
jgi:hypothetical protein